MAVMEYATRTAIKNVSSPSDGDVVFLAEAGREGHFVFDSGNHETAVSDDSYEGVYLGIGSPAGNGGAWIREYDNDLDVKWFGAAGDGTIDDTLVIQDALDLAVDLEVDVSFPNGTYKVTKLFLTDAVALSIIGHDATLLRDETGTNGFLLTFTDCDLIEFAGFTVNGRNSYRSGLSFNGVELRATSNSRIHGNVWEDCRAAIAIYPDTDSSAGSHRNSVDNNIGVEGRLPYSKTNEDNKLLNETFVLIGFDQSDGSTYPSPVYCEENVVRDNRMSTYRIVLANYSDQTKITGNICTGSTDSAIYFANHNSQFTANDNTIIEAGKDGIKVLKDSSGGTISSNIIRGSGQNMDDGPNCILIDDSEDTGNGRISVSGNTIELNTSTSKAAAASTGIRVRASNVNVCANNISCADPDPGDTGTEYTGIIVTQLEADISDVLINGNMVSNVRDAGVLVVSDGARDENGNLLSEGTVSNIVISDNVFAGLDSTYSDARGIKVDVAAGNVDNVLIQGNIVRNWKKAFHFDKGTNLRLLDNVAMQIDSGLDYVAALNQPDLYVGRNFADDSGGNFLPGYSAINFATNTTSHATTGTIYNGFGHEVHDNSTSAGSITLTLPRANPGGRVSFVRSAAYDIVLDGASSEQIEDTAPGTGTYSNMQTMSTADAACTLECIKPGRWELTAGGY